MPVDDTMQSTYFGWLQADSAKLYSKGYSYLSEPFVPSSVLDDKKIALYSPFVAYLILPVCNNRLLHFSYLDGKHNERYKYHDDHQELWGPNLWRDISETNRREGDHAEVKGVEKGQVIACSFQVLDTADADQNQFRKTENEEEKRKKGRVFDDQIGALR